MPTFDEVLGNLKDTKRFRTGDTVEVEFLKTPSAALNRELGGGFAYARQALIWGVKSAGKTSFALQCMAQAQRDGKVCAFVDAEGTFDPAWAKRLGVDPKNMLYDNPKSWDEIDKAVADLLQAGVDMALVDSVTAGIPSAKLNDKGEYQGASSNNSLGQKARQTAEVIEGWNLVNRSTLLMLISQTRKTTKGMYWVDEHTNGQAVAFYSSQILKLMSSPSDKQAIEREVQTGGKLMKRAVGRKVDWTVMNNKLGRQWGNGTYDFYFDGPHVGVDSVGELVDVAVQLGLLHKGGAWYTWRKDTDEERKWQGRDSVVEDVRADAALLATLEAEIYGLF